MSTALFIESLGPKTLLTADVFTANGVLNIVSAEQADAVVISQESNRWVVDAFGLDTDGLRHRIQSTYGFGRGEDSFESLSRTSSDGCSHRSHDLLFDGARDLPQARRSEHNFSPCHGKDKRRGADLLAGGDSDDCLSGWSGQVGPEIDVPGLSPSTLSDDRIRSAP